MSQPSPVYSNVSIALHWIIALLVFGQIGLVMAHDATHGSDMSRTLLNLHKSGGLLILVLTLVRIGWRFKEPMIALPAEMPGWEKLLARGTQIGFYLILIGLPLGGWAASSAAARDISFYGLFDWPLLPIGGGREAARQFMAMHELGAKALYVLLFLHIAGALKHQFINRDNILRRMLPFIRPR
ncbi:cytochrome b [Brevundimonas aveniformis]|uniref:cytochrome b n=1 Tax=Brevundimonas aveniformis TaxID=370977 RepID=UPI0003FC3923|nr:cytochrome b [Brevundimonas aveniformis]